MICHIFLLFALIFCHAKDLVDDPVVGDTILYLDGDKWMATDGKNNIAAKVPGDLITDLYQAKVIGDPIYETNWLDHSDIWDKNDWNYTTTFTVPSDVTGEVYLIFDGIKMGSYVILNNMVLGNTLDQFLRYRFPITSHIRKGASNTLVVRFPAMSNGLDCQGRFMACTGGWDWAPYSNTHDQHGSKTLSKGIWKSVYLVSVSTLAITYVAPQIYYLGDYPLQPLTDKHGGFKVDVHVHVLANAPVSGSVEVSGEWGVSQKVMYKAPAGESVAMVTLSATDVQLWWPLGMGAQKLYNINVAWVPDAGQSVKTQRRVGFRVFTIVNANDSDPSSLKGKDGSGTFTMRFRVNGASIWSRGGNMIPMEEFEGRANADAFRALVHAAAEGRMNTFRIWGGGIFLYDAFYDASDELGIIMYHDMMYAQGGHSPSNSPFQDAELRHQVRRLSHHPSIVIWDGCNECDGMGLYESFVMTTVVQEDKSRPIWPSCPSAGWVHGVDSLWGLPDGITLNTRGSNSHETHGYYQHGDGFKTVDDGDGVLHLFNPNIPPPLKKSNTGPEVSGIYASEFGCCGMSSFESMAPTLAPNHWSLHAPPMSQRNYPCDNIIIVYWGNQDFSAVGEMAFKRQLFQCLIGQALVLKSDIETRRSTNEFGTITWQLNEIWPTGGWGSIEYGTPVKGQVVGGRWKPVHYWFRRSIFADVMSTCDNNAECYVKNDGIMEFQGTVTIAVAVFATGKITTVSTNSVSLQAGAGITKWFCASSNPSSMCRPWPEVLQAGGCSNNSNCMLIVTVTDKGPNEVSRNEMALTTIRDMKLPNPTISLEVANNGEITVQSDAVAVYFTLTTEAQGRFSDNAFLLLPGKTTVQFMPIGNLDVDTLKSTLRFEHARLYQ